MKIGVSAYSFHKLLTQGTLKLEEVPAIAAKMGYDAVEFVDFEMPEEGVMEYAAKLRACCEEAGIEVACYAVGGNMLAEDYDAAIAQYKAHVDVAAVLGAPILRHDLAHGPVPARGIRTYEDALPILAKGVREVADYAQTKGIRTTTENHGYFSQDSIRVERLVSAVGHPNFGLLVDIGNFMCADEVSDVAVGRVAALAYHVHAKDFFFKKGMPVKGQGWFNTRGGNSLRGTILGHGVVPLAQCLGTLKRAGYDGTVSVEFEGMEDVLEAVAMCRENLKAAIDSLA